MPLRDSKIKPQSWEEIKEQFVIFYASKDDDGIMWCPVRSWGGRSGWFLGFSDESFGLGLPCGEGDRRGNF